MGVKKGKIFGDRATAAIFRRAAEVLVEEFEGNFGHRGEFSCNYVTTAALEAQGAGRLTGRVVWQGAALDEAEALRAAYEALFDLAERKPVFGDEPEEWLLQSPTAQTTLARSIALCLAADLALTGDL